MIDSTETGTWTSAAGKIDNAASIVLIHEAGQGRSELTLDATRFDGFDLTAVGFDPLQARTSTGPDVASGIAAFLDQSRGQGHADLFVIAIGRTVAPTLRAIAFKASEVRAVALVSPRTPIGRWPKSVRSTTVPKLLVVGGDDKRALHSFRRLEAKVVGPHIGVHLPTSDQGLDLLQGEWSNQVAEHIAMFFNRSRKVGH